MIQITTGLLQNFTSEKWSIQVKNQGKFCQFNSRRCTKLIKKIKIKNQILQRNPYDQEPKNVVFYVKNDEKNGLKNAILIGKNCKM